MSAAPRMLPDAPWMIHGECRGCDPNLFFPEDTAPNNCVEAKAICATCPVETECLDCAMSLRSLPGVWGGTTERDRRRIRRRRRESGGGGSPVAGRSTAP